MDIDRKTWDRFNSLFIKSPACWLWAGVRPVDYGRFSYGEQSYPAHRFSYLIHKGDIPEGLLVRHTCDVPACVNPDHLLVGSFADNSRDAVERDRWRKTRGRRKPYGTYVHLDARGRPYAVAHVRMANGKYRQLRKRVPTAEDAPRVAKLLIEQWKERNPEQVYRRRI